MVDITPIGLKTHAIKEHDEKVILSGLDFTQELHWLKRTVLYYALLYLPSVNN